MVKFILELSINNELETRAIEADGVAMADWERIGEARYLVAFRRKE